MASRFDSLADMAFCKIADVFGEMGEVFYQKGSPPRSQRGYPGNWPYGTRRLNNFVRDYEGNTLGSFRVIPKARVRAQRVGGVVRAKNMVFYTRRERRMKMVRVAEVKLSLNKRD